MKNIYFLLIFFTSLIHAQTFTCGTVYEPEEEFAAMTKLLQAILSDDEPILFSSKHGYTLTDNVEEDLENKDTDEVLTVSKWSEL